MTPKKAKALLSYNPITGRFHWLKRRLRPGFERIDKGWNTRFVGRMVAERRHRHGHLQIGLHCKNYMAHRLAWMIFYGEKPPSDIDHKNGDPSDNRIENLRLCTDSENLRNSKTRTDNTSGIRGVSWDKKSKKWYAYINTGGYGSMLSLGRFEILAEAIAARKAAEIKYFGEFARAA